MSMPKKRKLTEEPAITLWVRERYGYPPIPITCKKSDTIAHLVGRLMKTFYPKGATKSGYIIARHNNVTIHHKTKLGDVRDVSAEDPIILDQHVPFELLLDNYMVTPSTHHMFGNEVGLLRALVPEARNFYEFVRIVQKKKEMTILKEADKTVYAMYLGMSNIFEFQRNEPSVSLKVAMFLSAALTTFNKYRVVPFHNLHLPFKKRGPPYQTDFLIKLKDEDENQIDEDADRSDEDQDQVDVDEAEYQGQGDVNQEPGDENQEPGDENQEGDDQEGDDQEGDDQEVDDNGKAAAVTTVIKNGQLIMVIEVKQSVAIDLTVIDAHDTIEMILYCHYLMRLYGVEELLGTITDGHVWHTIKFRQNEECKGLRVLKYVSTCSQDEKIIIGSLPQLFNLDNV